MQRISRDQIAANARFLLRAAPADLDLLRYAFMRLAYPTARTALAARPERTAVIPPDATDETFTAALEDSGAYAITEHLYPTAICQSQ